MNKDIIFDFLRYTPKAPKFVIYSEWCGVLACKVSCVLHINGVHNIQGWVQV